MWVFKLLFMRFSKETSCLADNSIQKGNTVKVFNRDGLNRLKAEHSRKPQADIVPNIKQLVSCCHVKAAKFNFSPGH